MCHLIGFEGYSASEVDDLQYFSFWIIHQIFRFNISEIGVNLPMHYLMPVHMLNSRQNLDKYCTGLNLLKHLFFG